MTPEKLAAILVRQIPDSEKRRRADFVVDTSVAIAETLAEVDTIIESLRTRGEGKAYARHWR
jgi:dephospho-CoA kinase